jgi:hypothetical protein
MDSKSKKVKAEYLLSASSEARIGEYVLGWMDSSTSRDVVGVAYKCCPRL